MSESSNPTEMVPEASDAGIRAGSPKETVLLQAQMLQAVISATPLATICLDRDGMVRLWNPAAQGIYGWREHEVRGRPVPFIPEDREDEYRITLDRVLKGESLAGLDTRHQKKDGTSIDVSVWTASLHDGNGDINGVMIAIADITERKQTETALRQAEEKYRSIYDNAALGIFQSTADGRYLSVNPAAARWYGADSPEEMLEIVTDVGRQIYVDPGRRAEFLRMMQRPGGVSGFESQNYRKDGSVRWTSQSGRAVTDDEGAVAYYEVFVEDITDRKQAEETQRELVVLEERNRLARELHDSVTQSLYSLTLFSEIARNLANSRDLNQLEHYLTRLSETSQQALKEMRLLVYELRPLELEKGGLIGALEQRLEAVERRAGIEARLLVDGTIEVPPSVEDGLFRVAQEALNNSLKHAAATSVTVRVIADAHSVALEVEDNGRGFNPNTAHTKGGMGLDNMRGRALELGGSLSILSQPEAGTTVKVIVSTDGNS